MTDYKGACTVTRLTDAGADRLRIDQADPHVRISPELLDEVAEARHPDVTLTDGVLRIFGANRTVAYRIGERVDDEFGGRWYRADLVTE